MKKPNEAKSQQQVQSLSEEQLQSLREQCQSSLLAYAQWIVEPLGSFKVKPFHEKICDALEQVLIGKKRNLIITMPPRT